MEIYKRIKKLREQKGISLRELESRINISYSHLSRIENNKKKPNLDLLEILSKFYDVPMSYFFGTPTPEELLKLAAEMKVDYYALLRAAGYVVEDSEFTNEEIEFLKQLDEGVPIVELLKLNPTIDNKEITPTELELAVNVIRSLRKTQTPQ